MQQPQSIQTNLIHATKHHSQHRRHGKWHGNLEWKGVTDTSASVSASQWFWYSSSWLIPLYCSTSRLTCFWAIFHHQPLFRQTPVWLGRSSKNMCIDLPESWNLFAFDLLNCSHLEQTAAITASLKKERKEDAVGGWQFYLHTVTNQYQYFNITCIALLVRPWIFLI